MVLGATDGLAHAGNIGMRTSNKGSGARADNTVVYHFALCIWTTGCTAFTGVSTLVADTSEVVQTLLIGATSHLAFVRNADFSVMAFVVSPTESVTVLAEASFPICTVTICRALHSAPCFNTSIVVATAVCGGSA